jgi:hypothetical protein
MMIRRAFTMVELLVATAATMILVLFLNQIFSSLSAATSMGRSTSTIIENARVIGPQVIADSEEGTIIGPAAGGFLVIVNHTANMVGGVAMPINLTRESQAAVGFPLRSDQVMLMRNVLGAQPMAPGTEAGFQTDTAAATIKVWYGHGLRTMPDGADPLIPMGGVAPPRLGHAGTPNAYAVDWILTRQALFLDGALPVPHIAGDPRFYAQTAEIAAPVLYDNPPPNWPMAPAALVLGRGLTDLAAQDMADITADLTTPDYTGYAKVYNYIYAAERLRMNPDPASYEPWQIAQKHPFFADRCIYFAVDFAGDYEAPAGLDVVPPGGIPFTDVNGVMDTYPAGMTKWYTSEGFANEPGTATYDSRFPATFVPAAGFDVVNPGGWTDAETPHRDNGSAEINAAAFADGAFIFRNGSAAGTNWPKLLRFQYRLIDARGVLVGADGLPGKVFEQIIKIDP